MPFQKDSVQKQTVNDIDISLVPFRDKVRFTLASSILSGVAVIFILGGVASLFASGDNDDDGDSIFEACKAILPPIATLVIGYYYGEKKG